jgi:dTDP-4-dehydrorhamnose 3,5-epimerase
VALGALSCSVRRMIFEETPIEGVFVVDLEPHRDERGFFARAYCASEFANHGLVPDLVQANLALSNTRGTTRGLHYQAPSHPEAKFFRCLRGEIFNVAVDMRPGSSTFGGWAGVVLSAENRRALYIPPVCAAGYQTLVDDTEILYSVSGFYAPEAERGVRHDDPTVGVEWPLAPTVVSEKDRRWPLLPPGSRAERR